jgi:diaminohydroxyphosphoribosylaminopyrimidine deaminase/5-amino-6-(5-phosphoribosylamino)uracil reductase
MQLALNLAQKGRGNVAPNPMVACIIVCNGKIVAEGYHQKYGEAHAEVNAINNLSKEINIADCTLYVTLEPCSHHGKTPPCADLIIGKGFKKVVICNLDPNPLVAGQGIEKLKLAGVDVITGVLEEEGAKLNKYFFTFYSKKRPYFILKWAQTADGFISKWPIPANREEQKISSAEQQIMVHQLRSEVMGIMVGKNTLLNDNPNLTTRLVKGKNPIRIFIDKNLEVPLNFNIYNKEAETIVFNSLKEEVTENIKLIKFNFEENILKQISEKLYKLNIQSVLVEGGAFLLNDFINQKLHDEVIIYINEKLNFGTGIKAPLFNET